MSDEIGRLSNQQIFDLWMPLLEFANFKTGMISNDKWIN